MGPHRGIRGRGGRADFPLVLSLPDYATLIATVLSRWPQSR